MQSGFTSGITARVAYMTACWLDGLTGTSPQGLQVSSSVGLLGSPPSVHMVSLWSLQQGGWTPDVAVQCFQDHKSGSCQAFRLRPDTATTSLLLQVKASHRHSPDSRGRKLKGRECQEAWTINAIDYDKSDSPLMNSSKLTPSVL